MNQGEEERGTWGEYRGGSFKEIALSRLSWIRSSYGMNSAVHLQYTVYHMDTGSTQMKEYCSLQNKNEKCSCHVCGK